MSRTGTHIGAAVVASNIQSLVSEKRRQGFSIIQSRYACIPASRGFRFDLLSGQSMAYSSKFPPFHINRSESIKTLSLSITLVSARFSSVHLGVRPKKECQSLRRKKRNKKSPPRRPWLSRQKARHSDTTRASINHHSERQDTPVYIPCQEPSHKHRC